MLSVAQVLHSSEDGHWAFIEAYILAKAFYKLALIISRLKQTAMNDSIEKIGDGILHFFIAVLLTPYLLANWR